MKICMIGYTRYENDARLHRYASSLLEQGHEVDMVGLGEPLSRKPVDIAGVRVFRIYNRDFSESGPVSYLRQLIVFLFKSTNTMTRLQISNRYDVIHFHNIPDFGIFCTLWAKMLGAKVILDIHDLVPEFYMRKFDVSEKHWAIRLIKWIEKISCAFADHVITVTEIWRQRLIERSLKADKCSVIMNLPIDSVFRKLPLNPVEKNGTFLLTYHGNLAEQTGVDLLIRAVGAIRSSIPGIQLQIIGGGRDIEEYRTLTADLGLESVVFFKQSLSVTELPDAIKNAHVGVDPKRDGVYAGETLSVKAMEYLAMGIPLIVAHTKAAAYYFPETSVRFFTPDDIDSLAEAILDLYKNPDLRRTLHIHSDDFNRKYNWENTRKTYFGILHALTASTQA